MTDIFIIVAIVISFALFFYLIFTWTPKSEKEQDERMKKSLAEEYIIDPETGIKLTLEEAESGHWIAHDNEYRAITEDEISKLPYEEEQQVERALNHLRVSNRYSRRTYFENDDFDVLEQCITLSHYDDWSYFGLFSFKNGFIFSPAPETNVDHIHTQSQLMLWLKVDSIEGHYYFREKTKAEAFFDKLRSDDELKLDNYECFTFKKSYHIVQIRRIIDIVTQSKGLEIELMDDNLFIKSLRLINKDDVITFENIIARLHNIIKPFN